MIDPDKTFDDLLKEICRDFAVEVYHGKRMDIRERTAAIAILIKARELWETKDESNRGSAVKRYEELFQKAGGSPGGTSDTGPAAEPDADEPDDGNGADESAVPPHYLDD